MRNAWRYGPKCRVTGCNGLNSGYRNLCNRHAKRDLVHGDPEQQTITEGTIREPLLRLEQYIKTADGAAKVQAVVDHFCDLAADLSREWVSHQESMYRTGIVHKTDGYLIAQYVPKVFAEKDPRKTVKEMIAMAILMEENEYLFKSDKAALHELTYVFFRDTSASRKPIPGSRGVKAAPVYVNRRTRLVIGRWLLRNLIYYGLVLYRAWKVEGKELERRKRELTKTLSSTAVDANA